MLYKITRYSNSVYYFLFAVGLFGAVLSPFLGFMFQVGCLVLFFVEGNYKQRASIIFQNKALWWFVLLPLVHLLFLLNTTNFDYALRDLRVKIPLFIFPFIVATMPAFSTKQIKNLTAFFLAGLLLASLNSFRILTFNLNQALIDAKLLSPFISHIRYSLFLCAGIFLIIYANFNFKLNKKTSYTLWGLALLFALTVLIVRSLTGYAGLLLAVVLTLYFISKKNSKLIWFSLAVAFLLLAMSAFFLYVELKSFYNTKIFTHDSLPSATINGNLYKHDLTQTFIENGNFVYLFLCEKELESQWNKRSKQPFFGTDKGSNELRYTLMRYLTSKNLTKDSVGVWQLNSQEITDIENGVPNYIYTQGNFLKSTVYKVIWQFDRLVHNDSPNGHSITQRLEHWKTGIHILQNNLWAGTGLGDINDAFKIQYEIDNSPLTEANRHRAHNQWLTFFVSFGFLGGLLCVLAILIPPFLLASFRNPLFTVLFVLFIISTINEDTIETQAGVLYFSFFYSLIFAQKNSDGKTVSSYYNL
ncbi:MAG TPA: hypothetical protein DCQ31_19170 [Bacteroidales bacterium]|nr:hypothetical protein [Bacteroidales bacterium]